MSWSPNISVGLPFNGKPTNLNLFSEGGTRPFPRASEALVDQRGEFLEQIHVQSGVFRKCLGVRSSKALIEKAYSADDTLFGIGASLKHASHLIALLFPWAWSVYEPAHFGPKRDLVKQVFGGRGTNLGFSHNIPALRSKRRLYL